MRSAYVRLCSLICSLISLFCVASCNRTSEYDYTAKTLVIEEREKFAPCYFSEFFHENEYTKEFFKDEFREFLINPRYTVTIDGTVWTAVERVSKELPKGRYDIVVETYEPTDGGDIVTSKRRITIPVWVSSAFEDKYAEEME